MPAAPFRIAPGGGSWRTGVVSAGLLLPLLALASCRPASPPDPAPAEALAVRLSLDAPSVHVGDPVRVELTIDHPAEGALDLPEPAASFEVRSRTTQTERIIRGRSRTRIVYTLASFEIGDHAVFTNGVAQVAADGSRLEALPPPERIEVQSVLAASGGKPRDPKPPLAWPPALPRWIWALPAVFVAALAAALLMRWITRRRAARPAAPPPPAHETALAELGRLRDRGWIEAGAAEPFYVELSRIVRVYIEARFGLRAPESTTEEFLRAAAGSAVLSSDHRALARGFLEQCDLVKFARERPGAGAMRQAFDAAGRLVRETMPSAAVPGSVGEGAA